MLLNRQARNELEESMELTQRNRSFGPSTYCLRTDSLYHCPGLSDYMMQNSNRDLQADLNMSAATVLKPLKRVLGMDWLFDTHCAQVKH